MPALLPCLRPLRCHPDTVTAAVKSIEVLVSQPRAGVLALRFSLIGELAEIRIPPLRPPQRSDRLWELSCFEVFIRAGQGSAYREFNFSPSGEWAMYRFSTYRQRLPVPANIPPPELTRHDNDDSVEITAEIDLHSLALTEAKPLSLGLSAVIEESSGALSYWALQHPPGKPDFHHADCFALELDALH